MRHASAFGLFMLTDIVRYLSFAFYVYFPDSVAVLNVYLWCKLFWFCGSALSQVLLF